MNLSELLEQYKAQRNTQIIAEETGSTPPARLHLTGLVGSIDTLIAAATFKLSHRNQIFILNDKEEAAYFHNDLKSLLDKKDVHFFPDSYKKAGQFDEINNHNVQLRTESLNRFINSTSNGELLVTYPEALFEKVVELATLTKQSLSIRIGDALTTDHVMESLQEMGFIRSDFVYEPGEFSVRGGIIDIFSFGTEEPYRIELFGADVESIRN